MTTLEKVITIIDKNTGVNFEIHKDFNLTDDLGVDSLDSMMIINEIEDEFSISFTGNELGSFKVVNDIATTIDRKLQHKNS